jgi:hypothetical protein
MILLCQEQIVHFILHPDNLHVMFISW